jgi:hypothetical protein
MAEQQTPLTRELIRAGLKARTVRVHRGAPVTLMAGADGYVMVRRPGCMPFVMRADEWLQLSEAA